MQILWKSIFNGIKKAFITKSNGLQNGNFLQKSFIFVSRKVNQNNVATLSFCHLSNVSHFLINQNIYQNKDHFAYFILDSTIATMEVDRPKLATIQKIICTPKIRKHETIVWYLALTYIDLL